MRRAWLGCCSNARALKAVTIKTILTNRLRDFDAALHAEKKLRSLAYALVRQFSTMFGFGDDKIIGLVSDNAISLYGKVFATRGRTMDLLFCSRFYEPETTAFVRSTAGNVCGIIGGHIGRYAVLVSDAYQKVYVFEPHPENCSQLRRNLSINQCSNVTVINAGVADVPGTAFMAPLTANTGAANVLEGGAGMRVDIETLDAFTTRNSIDASDFGMLLIDAEGYEERIVTGASAFLRETQAILIIEAFNPAKLIEAISHFGYFHDRTLDSYNLVFVKDPREYAFSSGNRRPT
jgi:FkbM family methyltransferase